MAKKTKKVPPVDYQQVNAESKTDDDSIPEDTPGKFYGPEGARVLDIEPGAVAAEKGIYDPDAEVEDDDEKSSDKG